MPQKPSHLLRGFLFNYLQPTNLSI